MTDEELVAFACDLELPDGWGFRVLDDRLLIEQHRDVRVLWIGCDLPGGKNLVGSLQVLPGDDAAVLFARAAVVIDAMKVSLRRLAAAWN